jgi:hypothetical protein
MPSLALRRRRIALPVALSLGLFASVTGVRADDAVPPKDKPAGGDAKPAEPVKPGDPAKPSDPSTPADPGTGDAAKKPAPVKAPDFTLKDLDGKERKLSEFAGKYVVLEWTNYGCPYVKNHYKTNAMQTLQKTYTDKGVIWLSICSSAEGKEGFLSPEDWKKAVAERKAVPTAVLPDADGTVGHLYAARTTPDMRVIDPKGNLIYSGAIDDTPSPRGDPAKAKNYVALVLDAVLAGKEPPLAETKSYG